MRVRLTKTFPQNHIEMPGTDEAYLAWVRTQPSCISGQYSEYVNGEGLNPACHVRRSSTFGTGFKALFSAIPMTHQEHHHQTVAGEAACLALFLPDFAVWDKQTAKEWFDDKVLEYRQKWMESL